MSGPSENFLNLSVSSLLLPKKGDIDGAGPAGEVPTVSWPEHAAMETGDVVITVEHCHGCQRHRMTTRHDPEVNKGQSSR